MSGDIFDRALAAFQSEKDSRIEADNLWAEAEKKYADAKAARATVRGETSMSLQNIIALAKKYYPIIATGGVAGALPAILADTGGFSGLKAVFGKLLGVFGLGG